MTNNIPPITPHIMPWNENVLLDTIKIPQKNEKNIAPVIESKSAIVVDLKTGLILYEKNIHKPMYIASLTKLMTTTIVLEENDKDEITTISKNVTTTEGKKLWLQEGEEITVKNLLYAALIESANDAAIALAEHNAGTVEKFVEKMNKKSKELGLNSTHFINPTGLDKDLPTKETNGLNTTTKPQIIKKEDLQTMQQKGNISTVYDLTILSRYAYGKSFLRRAVNKEEMEIASINEKLQYKLKTTNALLDSYLPIIGLKTGTTDNAGQCFITIVKNKNGNNLLTIVLNSPNRFQETKSLIDWTLRTYTW